MKGRPGSYEKKGGVPWIKLTIWLLLVIAPCVWVLLQFADFPLVAPKLERTVKEYRAAGLPWIATELVTPVTDEHNAAVQVKEAIALAGEIYISEREKELAAVWKSGDKAEIQKSLAKIKPILDRYVEASKKPLFNYDRDWNEGISMMFPEYAELKSVAKVLVKRAIYSAKAGDLTSSSSDLEAASRLGNLVAQEPSLIAMLVGIAMNAIALDGVVRIAEVRSDTATLRKLQQTVYRLENNSNFELAVRGEAFAGVTTTRNLHLTDLLQREGPGISVRYTKHDGLPSGVMMRAIMVRHLETHIGFKKILAKHPDNSLAASLEMDTFAARTVIDSKSYSRSISAILVPIYVQAGNAILSAESRKQMTLLILKSLEYKNKHGKLPQELSVLGMSLHDRATGKNILSTVDKDIFMVYSVGLNGIDNKGVRIPDSDSDDLTVRFPPKPWQ